MNHTILLVALGLLLATFTSLACTGRAAGASGNVDPRALVAAGAPVIDVRNPDEWEAGHLDKAILIPLPEFRARASEVEALVGGDKSKPVVLVCRSGNRAGQAKAILEQAGYTNIVNGGAWTNLK